MSASELPMIRAFVESDQPELMQLYQHLNQEPAAVDPPDLARVTEQYLQNPAVHCFVGVDATGKLVSSATLLVLPNLTRQCRPYALIENVVTHGDHRRAGWGRKMLQFLIRQALAAGCYKTMLMSNAHRKESHDFYRACGFDGDAKQAFIIRHD